MTGIYTRPLSQRQVSSTITHDSCGDLEAIRTTTTQRPETWKSVKDQAVKELCNKRLFVVDAFCGANKDTRMAIRFIMEVAWQAHFVTNMSSA